MKIVGQFIKIYQTYHRPVEDFSRIWEIGLLLRILREQTQSVSHVLQFQRGRWTSPRDPQGKKFLQVLVLCSLFLTPKPVPLGDFGAASQNAHAAEGQGFVRQTSGGVIQSVRSREADPLQGLSAPSGCGRTQINGHAIPPADKPLQGEENE